MTPEEYLIQRYFDAFNRHDIEGVVACFHDDAVLVGPNGKRLAGIAEVRRSYETEFALFPDAHCELRVCTGNSGRGVAESYFTGTRSEQRSAFQKHPGESAGLNELGPATQTIWKSLSSQSGLRQGNTSTRCP